ncbi:hypothetical protein PYW08_016968 [Mythimna loreyi]|nr:hypothetical protein PYW08_016968 [Mythimna loreyi]
MSVQRTPPKSQDAGQSTCEPDLNKVAAGLINSPTKIAKRNNKRTQRVLNECTGENFSSFKDEVMSMINQFRVSQNNRLDKLEEYMISIQDQNKVIQKTNLDIENSVTHLSFNVKTVEDKIDQLEHERKQIYSHLSALEEKLDRLEMSSLKTFSEIRNVPKVQNEKKPDLFGYVMNLSRVVNYADLCKNDIRDVARMPSKRDTSTSSIAIEFTNTLTKLSFLEAVKKYNQSKQPHQLNSNDMGINVSKQQIYISELLTPKMKRLLFLTRDFAKTADYKFVWTTNGQIYLRKVEGKPYIRVNSEAHLNEIKKSLNKEN